MGRLVLLSLVLLLLGISMGYVWIQAVERGEPRIVVYAGAAAAPVYREVAELFEETTGVKVELRIGGSGILLSQLQTARDGDVYIPGSQEYLTKAARLGVVDASRKPVILAYLVPAIIVAKGNPKEVSALEDLARPDVIVAIADPETVCVGAYAVEILERRGLWEAVSRNIRVYASSCEHLANLVITGAVDAIIGWHVFHYWNPNATELVLLRPEEIPKIGYIGGAVTVFSKNKELAERFLEFLASDKAAGIWKKYGYLATLEEALRLAPYATVEEAW